MSNVFQELQSKTSARIKIDDSGTLTSGMRLITLIGTEESVVKAEEVITFLIKNPSVDSKSAVNMIFREKTQGLSAWGSGPPYSSMPNNGQNMKGTVNNNQGAKSGGLGKTSYYGRSNGNGSMWYHSSAGNK